MLQPTVRRTWAPRGQTPTLKCYDRHDRLSAISAITVSPKRKRLGLYFDIQDRNVKTDDFVALIERVVAKLSRPILLVMDRYSVHRSAARRWQQQRHKRITIEWLPAYAPQLNPVEQVWNRAKHTDLANFVPDDVSHLGRSVNDSLKRTRNQQHLLRSFFRHARLNL